MLYTLGDVRAEVGETTYSRGFKYADIGNVISVSRHADTMNGLVLGSGPAMFYTQEIAIRSAKAGNVSFEGYCTCPVGYNCKHVAALLIKYLRDNTSRLDSQPSDGSANGGPPSSRKPVSPKVSQWVKHLENALGAAKATHAPATTTRKGATYRLIFAITPSPYVLQPAPALTLCKARLRVNGDVVATDEVFDLQRLMFHPPAYVSKEDQDLVRFFSSMRGGGYAYEHYTEPSGKSGAYFLRLLLQQKNLYWASSPSDLKAGRVRQLESAPERHAELTWRNKDDALRLVWQFREEASALPRSGDIADQGTPASNVIDYVLPTDPPLYIDGGACGELILHQGDSALPLEQLQELVMSAPPIDADNKEAVARMMVASGLQRIVPLPQEIPEIMRRDVPAEPVLTLDSALKADSAWHDYAQLEFRYDGHKVSPLKPEAVQDSIVLQTEQGIERIVRDASAEHDALQKLYDLGFSRMEGAVQVPGITRKEVLSLPSQEAWLQFARDGLPALAAEGWQIEKTPDYRFDLAEVEDWYADVDEAGNEPGSPWFDLELGIVVDQERISLLPVLVKLIQAAPQDFNPQALAAQPDSGEVLAMLPNGKRVALSWGRIKPLLNILGELYFTDKTGNVMRLSTMDAARLAELAGATQLRWMGGERLRAMGEKISRFGGISTIAPPAGLQASLRDYQKEGLSWMQFLREYELAGILADDMGLGKTVQTLAHILTEKEAGRLTQPALVIAPTSLMGNWQDEAARFTPALRVLVLQGKDRLAQFDQIDQADIVLTTYALLPRDEEKLRKHTYHLMILDEAQYIKNPRSRAAQIAGLLRARHRLCLTGTPLENHLGELWSQFHFLLPGLLGDDKSFNRDFRVPIEKLGDDARRVLLMRRLKPFILRRTKDKVAKELPAKTEMVRSIELSGAQRDLYETVRLAMDKKVRAEISKKGVARSQIVILEALLKLRQVCCDPRLVKLTAAKKAPAPSAKLEDFLQMLQSLLEDGRRILVFSQFTSMLALIEAELRTRKIAYALLTGDTEDRAGAVRAFQQGEVPLFLISLKAGGVGLNLTAADTVIHYDPWWNPAVENQATDRAWRIGQDKPVFVYKLIAKGTVEEKIQSLQQKKAELARAILDDGQAGNIKLTQDDLHAIFAPLEG